MAYPNVYPNTQNFQSGYPNQTRLVNIPQAQQVWNDYGEPIANWSKEQMIQRGLMGAAPIIPAGTLSYSLNNPQGKFAVFAATNFGRPIVNGMKNLAGTPVGQTVEKNLGRFANLFW